MGNEAAKKFTWVIKNFSSFKSNFINTDEVVIGGCKWNFRYETYGKYLSLFLVVAGFRTLPCRWRRHVKLSFTVVNQLSERLSQVKEKQHWLDQKTPLMGFTDMLPLAKHHAKDGGFLVNDEVKIVAEVEVLEVIGKLDVSEESQEVTQSRKRIKLNDNGHVSSHLHKETSSVNETIDVNGFQVLPSQAEYVKRIFEKHPNLALEIRTKNQDLRTSYMNALLSLIKMLCQSLQDLSIDDLGQAENALTYLKNSGLKVDWLEHKLEEVKEKKIEDEIGEIRVQELEEEMKEIKSLLEKKKEEVKDLKKKCSVTEALLKKEKANVLAARAPPLTLDDVV